MDDPYGEPVAAVRAGSRDAAAERFTRHWTRARRVALAVCHRDAVADDVDQDAMVQAFGAIATYRGDAPFGAWLHRIVANRAPAAVRAERRLVPPESTLYVAVEGSPHLADAGLRRAVQALPSINAWPWRCATAPT